jgi:hypothetical protein
MRLPFTECPDEQAVSNLLEYVSISGIVLCLLIVLMLTINTSIMEGPSNQLRYVAFTDIGNGVSTRIVDVYVVAPINGTITTQFDIPDEVAEKDYFVEIGSVVGSTNQVVEVSGDYIKSSISLAGIGATRGVRGNTTGRGMNLISYDSGGY